MSKYLVLDLETSGKTTYRRFCNPLDPNHKITAVGYKIQGEGVRTLYNKDDYNTNEQMADQIPLDGINLIVGQNIKFDLLWLWGNKRFHLWLQNGGKVWDTQTVEYLLSGQAFAEGRSLDDLVCKYGGTLKDDKITQLFKADVQAKDIPREDLIPYLIADVENTNRILQGQIKKAQHLQMLPIIRAYMEHYLAVTECEYNGMFTDHALGMEMKTLYEQKLRAEELELSYHIPNYWPSRKVEFNSASLDHVSILLFGGEVHWLADEAIVDEEGAFVRLKSGKNKGEIKTHKVLQYETIKGFGIDPEPHTKTNAKGLWRVDVDVFESILKTTRDPIVNIVLTALLSFREYSKLVNTYIYSQDYYKDGRVRKENGVLSMWHPHTGCVHSEFKTARTRTGRLSSTAPNLQNLPPPIYKLFKSRFANGKIVVIDYSQLEVCIQAYLTQSPKFIQDVVNGVDFHCKRLAYAENKAYEEVLQLVKDDPVWKLKRKNAKTVSFQKAYGASIEKIAKETGLTVEVVTTIFKGEDDEYPEINIYYGLVGESIRASRLPGTGLISIRDKRTNSSFSREGEQTAIGFYTSITGKRYAFDEFATLSKNGKVFRYFSGPQIQNYPVQGLAADIVAFQVGRLFRYLLDKRDSILLVNEIHDSIILDVSPENQPGGSLPRMGVDRYTTDISRILTDTKAIEEHFGIIWNVPLKVDVSIGDSWGDIK